MIYRFSNPEWFEDIEGIKINKESNIFLWGAGKIGTVVAHVLEQKGYTICGFVDSDLSKAGTMVYDYCVYSPEEYYKLNKNAITIVSCAFPSVISILEKKGIKAYSPHSLLLEIDFDGYRGELTTEFLARLVDHAIRNYALYYNKSNMIDRLVVMLTEKCTLKCKNCDAYIPYHCHPKQFSYEEIIHSYNTILKVCGSIHAIDLLGGEPLLHPELDLIMKYLILDGRCERITIISNGTIIPNQKVIECLKNEKCIFRISDYGKLSKKKDEIISLLEREQINYEITNYQYWDEIPRISYQEATKEELNLKFATCTANDLYVKGNIVCCCSFLVGLYGLESNKEMFPKYDSNIVYLDSGEDSERDLTHYIRNLHERKAIDACRYCPGSHCLQFGKKVPVAEQAEGFLPVSELYKNKKGL